ncbi:MAG: hypothetical protein IKZ89_09930 [Bacteroidaceae bacterium]|nr:hypothetical protein [Bacteroidaceae bacterium]
MKRTIFILLLLPFFSGLRAQTGSFREQYERFQQEAMTTYSNFRNECNRKYVEFLLQAWEEFHSLPEIPQPVEEDVPPVKYEDDSTPIKDNEVVHEEVVIKQEKEQLKPEPVEPIKETPVVKPESFSFTFYNTPMQIRAGQKQRFTLSSLSERELSNTWEKLCSSEYDNIVIDCLQLREKYNLCDWAYLQMIQSFAKSFLKGKNESTLLIAYIYSQCGYKMRLGLDDKDLYMLFGSKYEIYDRPYYVIDGSNYYPLEGSPKEIRIANYSFPKEVDLSLAVSQEPTLSVTQSPLRSLKSRDYPVTATCSVNKNLLDFFTDYPTSQVNGDPMTRWALYAQTPLDKLSKEQLYPVLKKAIADKTQTEAVNILLNFVQTAFVYEYDDKVWGGDRAFFAEETLYYPYCDCEDRSIMFSHLVRELVGLDVLLLYYPNHLCTAVKFTVPMQGDYLNVSSGKYYICDPTYIGAPIGVVMPDYKNTKPKAILLDK